MDKQQNGNASGVVGRAARKKQAAVVVPRACDVDGILRVDAHEHPDVPETAVDLGGASSVLPLPCGAFIEMDAHARPLRSGIEPVGSWIAYTRAMDITLRYLSHIVLDCASLEDRKGAIRQRLSGLLTNMATRLAEVPGSSVLLEVYPEGPEGPIPGEDTTPSRAAGEGTVVGPVDTGRVHPLASDSMHEGRPPHPIHLSERNLCPGCQWASFICGIFNCHKGHKCQAHTCPDYAKLELPSRH